MAKMKDVADLCKVSVTTVSRVLNEDPTLVVSQEVRDNIFREAARIGYKTPRQRNRKEIFNVALVLDAIEKPGFEKKLLESLKPMAETFDISLKLFNYADEAFDALIVLGEFSDDDIAYFSSLTENVLLINNRSVNYDNDLIKMDYQYSSGTMFNFFKEKGVKSIGYFAGTCNRNGRTIGATRMDNFRRLLEDNGMYRPELFKTGKMTYESGYEMMMHQTPVPDGILFGDNDFMRGGIAALKDRGLDPITVGYDTFVDAADGADAYLQVFTEEVWDIAFKMLKEKLTKVRKQSLHVTFTPRLAVK